MAYSTTTVDWRDPSSIEAYYEGVSINGIYLENYYSTLAWKTFKVWKSLESKVNKEEWDEDSYVEQVNAFYQPSENIVSIRLFFVLMRFLTNLL